MRIVSNILVCGILLASCRAEKESVQSCAGQFDGSYSGVALATEAGDTSFALSKTSAIFVSGPPEYYEQIAEAWAKSPYSGGLRPVNIEVEGVVRLRDRDNLAPVLDVTNTFDVSLDFSQEEVERQFRLRMNRGSPSLSRESVK